MTVKECPVFWTTSTIKLLKQFGIGEEGEEGVAGGWGSGQQMQRQKRKCILRAK